PRRPRELPRRPAVLLLGPAFDGRSGRVRDAIHDAARFDSGLRAAVGRAPEPRGVHGACRGGDRRRVAAVRRAEKARRLTRILDRLHPEAAIPLDHEDPFTLLVAVVLSAQCTDERVNQVTPVLFARASTPDAMAKLSVAEIERVIRSCGLAPSKAKAIR